MAVMAAQWTAAAATVNVLAVVVFVSALCWRLDQIRRSGGGLQAVAMTISVAALTLAFAVSNASAARTLDDVVFAGAARVALYGLLAIGVAGLIVVFFYPRDRVTRERRAGVEAVPLVAALVGLQVSLYLVPSDMRTASMSEWTLTNWGYAAFYLIATGYLAYGFLACLRSVWQYLALAEGYLRHSLSMLIGGLGLLAAAAITEIVYVLGNASGLVHLQGLLTASRVIAVLGVVGFLLGISYPMVQARWRELASRRRRRNASRRLLPLWTLVTDAVPEVVLPGADALSPTALLNRRVVEIRDALTQLSPFLPPVFDYAEADVAARMILRAVDERLAQGPRAGAVRHLLPATSDTLEGDAEPLLAVSEALAAETITSETITTEATTSEAVTPVVGEQDSPDIAVRARHRKG
ncbi:MAB_1171c family putative transporter [Gordonia sp. VNQ95]|uniref:MAB_1171c family putative transporter n=1 Tax=Gordonia sp. VNQ95 TaxID=3156619 RepID=UPI0032B31DF2